MENSMNPDPGYAIGWGTLALINAGLAQSKDRSGLGWFLLSLLIGPLATLIIVLLDTLPPKVSVEADEKAWSAG
jgi:hypothetical protein